MSGSIEILNEKISTDKEILSVLPKNTKKNVSAYLKKANEIKDEYEYFLKNVIEEIKRRVNKINSIKPNPEIAEVETAVNRYNEVDLFGLENTSYEKMKLDELLLILRRFYKNNLEQVNNNILNCIKKFNEVGIELNTEDFNYSPFVSKYMSNFFIEYKKGDVNSQKMKEVFEEIYWECSDIIVHIELNIRYLYLKHEKEIDKLLSLDKNETLKELEISKVDCLEKYKSLKAKLEELKATDKKYILDKFINKELEEKDFEDNLIERQYSKMLFEPYEEYSRTDLEEISENIIKLSKTLDEYQNYLKYKFVADEVIKIYNNKEKYKNEYERQKKEIQKLEAKLVKTNKEYIKLDKHKSIFFFKKQSSEKLKALAVDINNQILGLKALYRKIEEDKVNDIIATRLSDNSTIYEALFLAGAFYTFLVEAIMKEFPEISEKEINETVAEIRNFITSSNITVINNITIKEDKDIVLMIKDKYNLFNINITKTDLDETVIGDLNNTVTTIVNACNLEKSGIKLDDIKFLNKVNKILIN